MGKFGGFSTRQDSRIMIDSDDDEDGNEVINDEFDVNEYGDENDYENYASNDVGQ